MGARRQWDEVTALFNSDVEMSFPDAKLRGVDQVLAYFQGVMAAFPDIRHEVVSTIGSTDGTAAELIAEATCARAVVLGGTELDVIGRIARFERPEIYETLGFDTDGYPID